MAFSKPGPGRPKGSPNKVNALVRDEILKSFAQVGGAEYLARMAEKEPAAYMTLLGKVLPTQVTGEGGGPIQIVTGVPRDEAN